MFKAIITRKITGSTLIEILIAVVIVGLVLTGLALSLTYSVKNSAEADYRQIATRYAQEVIEIAKQERNNLGWSDFQGKFGPNASTKYCFNDTRTNLNNLATGSCANNVTVTNPSVNFTRYVQAQKLGATADTLTLTSTVEWQDGSSTRDVKVEYIFYQR